MREHAGTFAFCALRDIAFKLHAQVLAHMFNLVESGQVQAPLWSPATSVLAGMTNQTYLREYLATKFRAAFPQLNKWVI